MVVENNPAWISSCPCDIIRPRYKGKVGTWLKHVRLPSKIQRKWDFILVDGPTGYSRDCIGRQEPIAFASKFGRTVFVHDWDRKWERQLCDYYLGNPEYILPFRDDCYERTLAVFERLPIRQQPGTKEALPPKIRKELRSKPSR